MLIKKLVLIALSAIMIFSLTACGEDADEGEVVAVVNGEELMRDEFEQNLEQIKEMYEMYEMEVDEEDEEMQEEMKQQVIDEMISETLLIQEAEAHDYTVDDEEIEEQIEAIEGQFETEEELEEALEMQNLDPDDLETEIANSLMIEQLIDDEISQDDIEVTEEELENQYEQQKAMQQDEEEEFPEFEEMKPQLEERIRQEKMQEKTGDYIEELRDESDVEILL